MKHKESIIAMLIFLLLGTIISISVVVFLYWLHNPQLSQMEVFLSIPKIIIGRM